MYWHRRGIKRFFRVVIFLVIVVFVLNIIPAKQNVEVNPFINNGRTPMIAAHRGGGDNNPENTMKAFKAAVNEFEVDIIESDLYLTKDGYLVYNHDSYIDRTCNVNGDITQKAAKNLPKEKRHYIEDYTLDELRAFNFGYYFEDENGNRPYKDIEDLAAYDLQIVEVGELFEEFYQTNKDLKFIIEIKNSSEKGYQAANILDDLLTNKYPDYKNQVVIGTFHDEIEQDLKENHPSLLRGASTGAAAMFVITEMIKLNVIDSGSSFACLQIPMEYDIKGINIKLDEKMYIDRAHKRNIAVQYWTINDVDEMQRLIELECDAIMTDNPKLLREVIEEFYKNGGKFNS